jgi:hypothetical protein
MLSSLERNAWSIREAENFKSTWNSLVRRARYHAAAVSNNIYSIAPLSLWWYGHGLNGYRRRRVWRAYHASSIAFLHLRYSERTAQSTTGTF